MGMRFLGQRKRTAPPLPPTDGFDAPFDPLNDAFRRAAIEQAEFPGSRAFRDLSPKQQEMIRNQRGEEVGGLQEQLRQRSKAQAEREKAEREKAEAARPAAHWDRP